MNILVNDSSAEDKWGKLGEVIGDASKAVYVYILVIVVLVILIAALMIAYVTKRRHPKGTGEDKKKNTALRIVIYILAGMLFLVLFPLIVL